MFYKEPVIVIGLPATCKYNVLVVNILERICQAGGLILFSAHVDQNPHCALFTLLLENK